MWFLPSRLRLNKLGVFFDAAAKTGMSTSGVVLVDAEEYLALRADYDGLHMPENWRIELVKAEGMAAMIQEAYERRLHGSDSWIGVLTDDITPMTPNWDTELIARLDGTNIVSADDCDQAPKRMEGATVWSTPLVDAIGWMAPPGLHHMFFDDVWERLGRATNTLSWAMSVKTKHLPITYSGVGDATSAKVKSFCDNDERIFRTWMADDYAQAVARVMTFLASTGREVVRPDLTAVSLYLATPDGDGTLDRVYVRSLMQTVDKVRQAGGRIDWAEIPYCADVSLARDRILGSFLRSPHTHLLMVDSDIGWNADDVLRLIQSGLDFVGGAGPKKNYPLRFCANSQNDDGSFFPGHFSEATQTLEVTGIGTGFLMVTRAVCERMIAAYPETKFDPGGGQTEYGLFDSLISPHGNRFADDFAFCWRWRAIGGKVHCMPSIKLKHVGSHCFEGSMLEAMQAGAQAAE